jgi:lysophospholipase L1-like esterase
MLTVGSLPPSPPVLPASAPTVMVGARLENADTVLGRDRMAAEPTSQLPSATPTARSRVVFFGSSTTEGHGANRRDRRYSTLLSQYLGWEEINAGKGGSRLSNEGQGNPNVPPSALMRWQQNVADKHPDRIILMYGANDMHAGVPLPAYQSAIDELLGDLKTVVRPENIIVATPQPVLKTAGPRPSYDAALERGAAAAGLASIDAEPCIPPEFLAEYSYDNWHLNDLGHAALASYMAAQLTDKGWAAPAPATQGGNAVSGAVAPMAAGRLLIENTNPLTAGELRHVEARFTGKGTAVVGVVRPNQAGGFDLVYKTGSLAVEAGSRTLDLPRWRTLEGDRLAVWTEGTSVAGGAAGSSGTLSVTTDAAKPMRDVGKGEGQAVGGAMAIRAIP